MDGLLWVNIDDVGSWGPPWVLLGGREIIIAYCCGRIRIFRNNTVIIVLCKMVCITFQEHISDVFYYEYISISSLLFAL